MPWAGPGSGKLRLSKSVASILVLQSCTNFGHTLDFAMLWFLVGFLASSLCATGAALQSALSNFRGIAMARSAEGTVRWRVQAQISWPAQCFEAWGADSWQAQYLLWVTH